MIELKKIRSQANMTQVELARQLNVAQSSVAAWENNESSYPRAELLPALADLLHCTIDDLFGRKERNYLVPRRIVGTSNEIVQGDVEVVSQGNKRF